MTLTITAIVLVIILFLLSRYFNRHQTNPIYGYAITLALFLCGLLLYTNEIVSISDLPPEESYFECTLSDFPIEKENSIRLKVQLNRRLTEDGSQKVKGSMILYNKKDISHIPLQPGDKLRIRCKPIEITNRGNPNEFDYRFYMQNQGIRYYAFTTSESLANHIMPKHRRIIHRSLIIREKLIEMYRRRGITGEQLAVVAAITLGEKDLLEPEQKQNFIKAGIVHIMAVSGLHALILSMFVFNMLFFMKGRLNPLRIIITIIILWSFAYVTGLTPSVLRATLMFSFLQAAKLTKRRVNGINSVLASAFILILVRPSSIFNSGFLLSYSAVIYIITFYNDFYNIIRFKRWLPDKIWQAAAVTIVAQAGTLPLTITLFNRFPTFFLITNIIIVPLASLLIVTACLVPLTYMLPFLSKFLAMILNKLTIFTESLTAKAASIPYSSVENIGMTRMECVALTIALFIIACFVLKKRPFSPLLPISALLIFVSVVFFSEFSVSKSNELIVFNTPGSVNIGMRKGKTLNLFSDSHTPAQDVRKECSTLRLRLKTFNFTEGNYLISAAGKKILLSDFFDETLLKQYKPDIIIINHPIASELKMKYDNNIPDIVIITSSDLADDGSIIRQYFSPAETIHFTKTNGAFIARL